ncbi:DUF6326 family protein (plasmid) [Rhodococcus antarcticus]|uniref:DUF6326 family protein n=1 Tax=Rhodococcus antarcticus TaxID=2987751 RepID=A0ABY6P578_9NOCA|nr:DUF6326 family protein [Rhodococcus antarcticus]UZJ26827.1 DUF6326 family protein [Rhodococcus antarcticus]
MTDHLHDHRPDVKIVLSGLWVTVLFVFAYVDIFSFWRADVIRGSLQGRVPDAGPVIDQGFLAAATAYVVVPSLMIVVSLLAPARINRPTNITVSLLYAVSVGALTIHESWIYYLIGSLLEVTLLLTVARTSWAWPRHDT